MNLETIITVLNAQAGKAAALSLSKGGFEGWLQAELWYLINTTIGESADREVAYSNGSVCDLVCYDVMRNGEKANQWVELKALGEFREASVKGFIRDVIYDLSKIKYRPQNTFGSVYLVVPKGLVTAIHEILVLDGTADRFSVLESDYGYIYYAEDMPQNHANESLDTVTTRLDK